MRPNFPELDLHMVVWLEMAEADPRNFRIR
jgi:hypothetical protein